MKTELGGYKSVTFATYVDETTSPMPFTTTTDITIDGGKIWELDKIPHPTTEGLAFVGLVICYFVVAAFFLDRLSQAAARAKKKKKKGGKR